MNLYWHRAAPALYYLRDCPFAERGPATGWLAKCHRLKSGQWSAVLNSSQGPVKVTMRTSRDKLMAHFEQALGPIFPGATFHREGF